MTVDNSIRLVAGLGTLAIVIGMMNVPVILVCGCILIGAALIAAAINGGPPSPH